MIEYLKESIVTRLGQRFDLYQEQLALLKLSTPSSGQGPLSKVIFLVFKAGQAEPFLVVKTVRKSSDNETIKAAYRNLLALYDQVKDSDFQQMFPEPLILAHDSNSIAFSIETACTGVRAAGPKVSMVVDRYCQQQKYLFSRQANYISDLNSYLTDLVFKIGLSQDQELKLMDYIKSNFNSQADVKFPLVAQHGDLTLDNILVSSNQVKIIDCERFGQINIAGFDLFQFLTRCRVDKLWRQAVIDKHLAELGSNVKLTPTLIFIYYLHELLIKKESLKTAIEAAGVIESYSKLANKS